MWPGDIETLYPKTDVVPREGLHSQQEEVGKIESNVRVGVVDLVDSNKMQQGRLICVAASHNNLVDSGQTV